MRLIHTGDLHIGKIVNEFSMLEDQKYILGQIIKYAVEKKVDALILAGDIYDRAIPPADAVTVFNDFILDLNSRGIQIFLISGNHDSPERIGFLSELLEKNKLYAAGQLEFDNTGNPKLKRIQLQKEDCTIDITLLPFFKPGLAGGSTNDEAVKKVLESNPVRTKAGDCKVYNLLVTHYFVTNQGCEPELSDSETTVQVGGLDNVEADTFAEYDYVALGHIHKAQQIGKKNIYYAGSPLKYSFSEAGQTKLIQFIELDSDGTLRIDKLPLQPLREMRKIKGPIMELMAEARKQSGEKEDFIQATLTDREEVIDPMETLRSVYPNVMQIVRENSTNSSLHNTKIENRENKSLQELFEEFYEGIRGEKLNEEQQLMLRDVIKKIEEEKA